MMLSLFKTAGALSLVCRLPLRPNPHEDWADLSRNEAAEVGVNVFHESHIQQREARLHRRQDVCMAGKRMISPLWLSPKDSL